MSALAVSILRGEEAFLVSAQANSLARSEEFEMYQLRTAECRIAVWDVATRSLVVFDTAALVAMAQQEAGEARRRHTDMPREIHPLHA